MATDKTCLTFYKEIEKYPKPCLPIRYPNKPHSSSTTSFHDLISCNLNALVPNIDMALHDRYKQKEIELWIKTTETYMSELHENMRNKCNKQLIKLKAIKQQEENCRNLDMERVSGLPDDLIRYIHEFLLPETRIQILLIKYPFYINDLNRITCSNLKKYLACVQEKYVRTALSYNSKFPERNTCIDTSIGFSGRFTKKEDGVNQLSNIFNALMAAIPKTPSFHRYFQKKAMRFLQSIIYIGVYRINDVRRRGKP